MLKIAIVASLLILSACSPQRRLDRLAAANPEAAASTCAKMFPVRESSNVRIERTTDTIRTAGAVVYVDCDSAQLTREIHDTVRLRIPVRCPDHQTIRAFERRDSIVFIENTAAVIAAESNERDAVVKAAQAGKARQMWMWAAIALGAYSVIRLVLRRWLKISLP